MKKTKIFINQETVEVTFKELYAYISDVAIKDDYDSVVTCCEDDYLKEKFQREYEEALENDELQELFDTMFSDGLDENNYEELTEKLLVYLEGVTL